jgi:hypothetical protein
MHCSLLSPGTRKKRLKSEKAVDRINSVHYSSIHALLDVVRRLELMTQQSNFVLLKIKSMGAWPRYRISTAMCPKLETLRTSVTQVIHPCKPAPARKGPWEDPRGKQEDGAWSERMAPRPTVRAQVDSQSTPSTRIHPVRMGNG